MSDPDHEVTDFINSVLKSKDDEGVKKVLHGKRARPSFLKRLIDRAVATGDEELATKIRRIMVV